MKNINRLHTNIISIIIIILVLWFILNHHFIIHEKKYIFVIYPKQQASFDNTVINITDWGIIDYFKNANIIGGVIFKIIYAFLTSDKASIEGLLEDTGMFVAPIGESGIFILKIKYIGNI
jgi:hypothetical protein